MGPVVWCLYGSAKAIDGERMGLETDRDKVRGQAGAGYASGA